MVTTVTGGCSSVGMCVEVEEDEDNDDDGLLGIVSVVGMLILVLHLMVCWMEVIVVSEISLFFLSLSLS